MLKSLVNYVNYNYQFCENIDSPFLSKDEKANECFLKSCLVYKNLHEIFNRDNITLLEIMIETDVTDFLFMPNSPVLKNHFIKLSNHFGDGIKKEDLRFTFLIQQSDLHVSDL